MLSLLGIQQSQCSVTVITNYVHGADLSTLVFSEDKPFVVRVYDHWLFQAVVTILIQLTHGSKLHVIIQICQALVYLHTGTPPLAHLDVKPANILASFVINNHMWLVTIALIHTCRWKSRHIMPSWQILAWPERYLTLDLLEHEH